MNHEKVKNEMLSTKYQKLQAVEEIGKNDRGQYMYRFLCDCGKECEFIGREVRVGAIRDCGCGGKYVQSIGKKFNYLTCIRKISGGKKAVYEFLCDCGNTVITKFGIVSEGNRVSCGCHKEKNREKSLLGQKVLAGTIISVDHQKIIVKCNCGNNITTTTSQVLGNKGHPPIQGCKKCFYRRRKIENIQKLIGQKINKLKVIAFCGNIENIKTDNKFICKCDCYNFCTTTRQMLVSKQVLSCGCSKNTNKAVKSRLKKQKIERDERIKTGEYTSRDRWTKCGIPQLTYKRDNFTCTKCGVRGGLLNAHHILNWRDNPAKEHRFGINNLATLCYDCHKAFHSKYGQRRNTLEQFEDYIGKKWKPEYVHVFEYDDYGILKFTDFDPIYLGI